MGACEPVCPTEAIYYEDDTPEEWADYQRANAEFFDDLGSPGGAAKMGVIKKGSPTDRQPAPRYQRLSRVILESLPDFPWDSLIPARNRAAEYPGAVCDLIGTSSRRHPLNSSGLLSLMPATPTDTLRSSALTSCVARSRRGCDAVGESTRMWQSCPRLARRRSSPRPAIMGLGPGARIGAGGRLSHLRRRGAARRCHRVLVDTDADPATWPADLDLLWLNSSG